MINLVVVSKNALKDLKTLPRHIIVKLTDWVEAVKSFGLQEVQKRPGYHDEPLKGRRRGQRSIRLSRAYRAIYEIKSDNSVEFVCVEEVTKHDY